LSPLLHIAETIIKYVQIPATAVQAKLFKFTEPEFAMPWEGGAIVHRILEQICISCIIIRTVQSISGRYFCPFGMERVGVWGSV
jgi:hypothetical protein